MVDAQNDSAKQVNVEDLMQQGVNVINQSSGFSCGRYGGSISQHVNIPVIALDRSAERESDSHMASDNVEGGTMAGEYIRTSW